MQRRNLQRIQWLRRRYAPGNDTTLTTFVLVHEYGIVDTEGTVNHPELHQMTHSVGIRQLWISARETRGYRSPVSHETAGA